MEEIIQYLSFGKHGAYIWTAWAVAVVVLAGVWLQTSRAAKRAKMQLDQLRPKRPRRNASVQSEGEE